MRRNGIAQRLLLAGAGCDNPHLLRRSDGFIAKSDSERRRLACDHVEKDLPGWNRVDRWKKGGHVSIFPHSQKNDVKDWPAFAVARHNRANLRARQFGGPDRRFLAPNPMDMLGWNRCRSK